jgi:hypothetical protein
MDAEVISAIAAPPRRTLSAGEISRRWSAFAAIGTEKTQVAAAHQGAAVLDEANREAAERMRPPRCISRNSFAEQDECDVAITDAGEIGIKRAQDKLEASLPLRAECWWCCSGASAQCTPKSASSVDAVLEKSIERHDDRDRHRGRRDAENQHLMSCQGCREFSVGAFRRRENLPQPCRFQGRADREECRRFGEKRQAWIVRRHPDDRGWVGLAPRIGREIATPNAH